MKLTIHCGGCGREVESCAGAHGEWMHTDDRREACPSGGYARPETPTEMDERINARRRRAA